MLRYVGSRLDMEGTHKAKCQVGARSLITAKLSHRATDRYHAQASARIQALAGSNCACRSAVVATLRMANW